MPASFGTPARQRARHQAAARSAPGRSGLASGVAEEGGAMSARKERRSEAFCRRLLSDSRARRRPLRVSRQLAVALLARTRTDGDLVEQRQMKTSPMRVSATPRASARARSRMSAGSSAGAGCLSANTGGSPRGSLSARSPSTGAGAPQRTRAGEAVVAEERRCDRPLSDALDLEADPDLAHIGRQVAADDQQRLGLWHVAISMYALRTRRTAPRPASPQ